MISKTTKDKKVNLLKNTCKWVERMAVGGGGGVLEALTTSDIINCDYLVSEGKVREFLNLITACGKHDLWQTH